MDWEIMGGMVDPQVSFHLFLCTPSCRFPQVSASIFWHIHAEVLLEPDCGYGK
jgi:hypothetical protein